MTYHTQPRNPVTSNRQGLSRRTDWKLRTASCCGWPPWFPAPASSEAPTKIEYRRWPGRLFHTKWSARMASLLLSAQLWLHTAIGLVWLPRDACPDLHLCTSQPVSLTTSLNRYPPPSRLDAQEVAPSPPRTPRTPRAGGVDLGIAVPAVPIWSVSGLLSPVAVDAVYRNSWIHARG